MRTFIMALVAERIIVATRGDAGERIDRVLQRHLADVRSATRTRVQAWIRNGDVVINGQPASRPAGRAAVGDRIHVRLPDEPPRLAMAAEAARLDVLFEDDQILAVNKPPGMVVHPTYRHPTGTLMNALLWHARGWPAAQRPSLVGRLDKLTSGIVVVAKTRRMHAALQRALTSAASQKDYLALVYGRVTPARGRIDLRLHRDDGDRRRVVASTVRGVASTTEFERLARVAAPRVGLTLLRCRLITGRMHQIRVHLAARGWPLVGDPTYGDDRWTEIVDADLSATLQACTRQALHAWRLALPHPMTGAALRICAPVPHDIDRLLGAAGLASPG